MKKGSNPIIKIYICISLGLLCIAPSLQATWKIMAVGNSITDGRGSSDNLGYRDELYKNLQGTDFQLVGPDGTSPYNGFYQSGLKIQDFYSGGYGTARKDITSAMDSYKPDVVLIHIGTNNVDDGSPAPYSVNNGITFSNTTSGYLGEFLKYVSQWADGRKGTFLKRILVCKIIAKAANGIEFPQVVLFNAQIDRMFFDQPPNIATNRMTIVDMYSQLDFLQDFSDDIHPNDNGYRKMAALYNEIIRGVMSGDSKKPGQIVWKQGDVTDSQTISAQWYATGDDYNTGRANLYEMRYAQFVLTEQNFSQGTLLSLKRPKTSGTVESTIISGLIASQIYHFAIRVYDELNNKGSVSDNLNIQMPGPAGFEYCDEFDGTELTDWSARTCFTIENSEMQNTCTGTGWTNSLAVYTAASYNNLASSVETSLVWSESANAEGVNACAIAMMLDGASYSTANGYMILARNRYIYLYEIVSGQPGIQISKSAFHTTAPSPAAGDLLKVKFFPNVGMGYTFDVFFNNSYIGQVYDSQNRRGNSDKLFSGVMLFGGVKNYIDSYCVAVPPLAAHEMTIYAGNNQNAKVTEKVATPLAVKVTDVNGLGVSDVQIQFSITSGAGYLSTDSLDAIFNGYIWFEAESGQLGSPLVTGKSVDASGETYIVAPRLPEYYDRGAAGYQIYCPREGDYTVWLRVYSPDGTQNSCYFAVANYDTTSRFEFKKLAQWAWASWPYTFHLTKGFFNFAIKNREPGTQIDKILLTTNTGYVPSGVGGKTQKFSNITDASGVAFTNLTLSSTAGQVEVTAFAPTVPNGFTRIFSVYGAAHDPRFVDYYPSSDVRILTGEIGETLDNDFALTVKDPFGNANTGINVLFTVEYGGGNFTNNGDSIQVTTDNNSVARVRLVLGYEVETKVLASLPDYPSITPLDFYGRTSNQPTRIELIQGDNQEGIVHSILPVPLTVKVFDGSSQPVRGYPVPFQVIQGNGTLTNHNHKMTVVSDSLGASSVIFTLGDTAGVQNNIVMVNVSLQNAPIYFRATAKTDTPFTILKLEGESQEVSAGKIFATPLKVKIADHYGNGIYNHSVKFEVIIGDGNFTNKFGSSEIGATITQKSDKAGITFVNYTAGKVTGLNQIRVEGIPALPQGSILFDKLNVLPPQPNLIEKVSGDNQTGEIATALAQAFRVKLLDAFGNRVRAGEIVAFQVESGGGTFIENGQSVFQTATGTTGEATAKLFLGTAAGVQVIKVYLPMYPAVQPIHFNSTATPGPAFKMDAASETYFSQVAAYGPALLKIRVTDQYGNLKPDHQVAFTVGQGGFLEDNKSFIQAVTDANGIASVRFYLGTNSAVVNTILATSNKAGSNEQLVNSPIAFTGQVLPDISAKLSKYSGDDPRQSGVIGTTLTQPFIVLVQDKFNNPVPDASVHFKVLSKDGKIGERRETDRPTDIHGRAYIYLTLGNMSGSASDTVQVSINDFPNIASVYFTASAIPGQADKVFVHGDSVWSAKLGAQPIQLSPQVAVIDNHGNRVTDFPVLFRIIKGNGTVDQILETWADTDQMGIASTSWTLGQKPDTNIVHAIAQLNGGSLINSPVEFKAITYPGEPQRLIRVSAAADTGVINQILADPIQIQIGDFLNNPIPNYPVTFKVTYPVNGGHFWEQGLTSTEKTILTNSEGIAQIYFVPVLGTNYIQAKAKNSSLQDLTNSPITFSIIGQQSSARQIRMLSEKNIAASVRSTHIVRVLVEDDKGAPVNGHPVIYEITKGSGFLGSTQKNWSSRKTVNGIAEETWTLGTETGADNNLLQITASNSTGVPLSGSPQIVNASAQAGIPVTANSSISATTDIVIDDNTYSTVTITLKDQYGNLVPNFPANDVRVIAINSDATIVQPSQATNYLGQTTARVSSKKAGKVDIYARIIISNVEFSICCAEIRFISNVAALLKIVAGNQQTGNVGAALRDSLIVQVTDKFGNPVAGLTVNFLIPSGNGFFLESGGPSYSDTSDPNGCVSVHMVLSQTSGTNTVSAFMDNLKVVFEEFGIYDSPKVLVKLTPEGLQGIVGDTLSVPLSVKVLDANNVPVWNAPITFHFTGEGSIVTANPARSDYMGIASASYKLSYKTGVQTVDAIVTGQTNKVLFLIQAMAGVPANLQGINTALQDTVGKVIKTPLGIRVLDKYSNPVPSVPVVFEIREGTQYNAEIVGDESATTEENGYAFVQFKIGIKVGEYIVLAFVPSLKEQRILYTISSLPGKPAIIEKYAGNEQFVTKGRELLFPIVSKVTDQYHNPVPQTPISFVAIENSGSVLTPLAVTDSMGLARCRWVLGQKRDNKLWAMKWGLLPNYVEFRATGTDNAFPLFQPLPKPIIILSDVDYCFPLIANDADGDPLRYTLPTNPPNAHYDPASHTFCWKPTRDQDGEWKMLFRVDDNKGGFDVDSLTVTVYSPPVIYSTFPAADKGFNIPYPEGSQLFSVLVTFTNPEKLTYEWYIDGVQQYNNDSKFLLAANNISQGCHSVRVSVSDGIAEATAIWNNVCIVRVELENFSAKSLPYKGVVLEWKTIHEINNLGFDILRSVSKSNGYEKLNNDIIVSRADGKYNFLDSSVKSGTTYFYKLKDISRDGLNYEHGPIAVQAEIPRQFDIMQNYPNPFNNSTKIRFQLPVAVRTRIIIFNMTGQEVKTLIDENMDPGYHEIIWTGTNHQDLPVASGCYYYRIMAGDFKTTKKLVLLK